MCAYLDGIGVNFATALHTKPESSLVYFFLELNPEKLITFVLNSTLSCNRPQSWENCKKLLELLFTMSLSIYLLYELAF